MFEGYFIALRKGPFRHAKRPISEAEMAHIALQYGLFRTAKWAISEHVTDFSVLRYGVYQNTILFEMPFILYDLTFIYISFAKIFCQNTVKKNYKFISSVFVKNVDIRRVDRYGKHLSDEP